MALLLHDSLTPAAASYLSFELPASVDIFAVKSSSGFPI